MTDTLLLVAYVCGAIVPLWPTYAYVLQREKKAYPSLTIDWADRAMAGFAAFAAAMLWPLLLAGYLAFRASRALWSGVLGQDDEFIREPEPRHEPVWRWTDRDGGGFTNEED